MKADATDSTVSNITYSVRLSQASHSPCSRVDLFEIFLGQHSIGHQRFRSSRRPELSGHSRHTWHWCCSVRGELRRIHHFHLCQQRRPTCCGELRVRCLHGHLGLVKARCHRWGSQYYHWFQWHLRWILLSTTVDRFIQTVYIYNTRNYFLQSRVYIADTGKPLHLKHNTWWKKYNDVEERKENKVNTKYLSESG